LREGRKLFGTTFKGFIAVLGFKFTKIIGWYQLSCFDVF